MVRVCEKTSVSALICAKNEENSLREVILGVRPNVDEIIVVDGHSADGTAEAARSLGCVVLLDHGKGKGEAVRLGLAVVLASKNAIGPRQWHPHGLPS